MDENYSFYRLISLHHKVKKYIVKEFKTYHSCENKLYIVRYFFLSLLSLLGFYHLKGNIYYYGKRKKTRILNFGGKSVYSLLGKFRCDFQQRFLRDIQLRYSSSS